MSKPKKNDSTPPKLVSRAELRKELSKFATKKDIDDLAIATERAFQQVVTKEDAKQFLTKEDAKQFATKEDLKSIKDEIIHAMDVRMEVRDDELQGKHQGELDRVSGKTETPAAWKSIPRRLTAVENEVEKIKDHLEIS